ncbi:hypothetical protein Ciccas_002364 [Cichlidogyrus casuarinus]|uniref:Uncharacterized protein n=1 Tax=Cichlidogyrus casuarinus TaxID=1844966 RepID=A0ABD2QHH1_9PLAT
MQISDYHHASFKPGGQETTLYDCGLLFNQPDTDSFLQLNSSSSTWPTKRDDSFSEARKPPNCSNGSISSENSSSSQPNNSSPSTYSPGSLDKRNKSLAGLPNNSLLEFMEGSRKRKAASEDEKWSENEEQEFQSSVAKRQEFDFNVHNSASHLLNQLQSSNPDVAGSSFPSGLSLLQSACCKVNDKACESLLPPSEFNAFRPYAFHSLEA